MPVGFNQQNNPRNGYTTFEGLLFSLNLRKPFLRHYASVLATIGPRINHVHPRCLKGCDIAGGDGEVMCKGDSGN